MGHLNYRKYPRNYKKNKNESSEKILDINARTAIGIVAFTFISGVGLGYLIKNIISHR